VGRLPRAWGVAATLAVLAGGAFAGPVTGAATAAAGQRLHEVGRLTGTADDPLVEPSGVLADAFGRVWASDASRHLVRRWQPDGTPLDETGTLGSEPDRFRRPGALARLGSLGVAVLDVENRRVVSYDHHLRLLGVLVDLAAPALESRLGSVRPVALAADRGGALQVVDVERDRILVFDFAGTFLREVGGFGGRAGGFAGLSGIACGPRGDWVTVERPRARSRRGAPADTAVGRARLQWLEPGGRVRGTAWTPVWAAGSGETSLAVAVDDSGRVAVAGERSGQLWLLAADGALIAGLDGLEGPRALAFAPDGTLLVAEAAAGRVRRLALEAAPGE